LLCTSDLNPPYHCFGPIEFPIPEELKNTSSEIDANSLSDMSILYFEMNNYSSKVQDEIRILYSGDFQYVPKINYDSRNVDVVFEVKKDKKEIYIKELPPNESLSISFFNTGEAFQVDQVLIGDQMVTSTMNKLAEFKRIPSFKWNFLFITMIFLLSLSVVGYSFYSMNKNSETNQLIAKVYENLGYMKCRPFEFDNAIGNEKKLKRKYQQLSNIQQQNTLILNKVSTYEKLKVKDRILFCLPKKI